MSIIQENPTYFSDKSTAAVDSFNLCSRRGGSSQQQNFGSPPPRHHHHPQQNNRRFNSNGATCKIPMTSYEDGGEEDGASEMETFLSSYESGNSYSAPETKIIRNNSYSCKSNKNNNNNSSGIGNNNSKFSYNSLRRKGKNDQDCKGGNSSAHHQHPSSSSSSSGISSLGRLGQLFKKSKSKSSIGSQSTVESSGLGSPTICTPDSSLSIYTNSLDGDSHSSTNSNQISPKHSSANHLEDSMEDNRYCATYTLEDCGIFAANMYYNVGESSVFTIYHQNNQSKNNSRNGNNGMRSVKGNNHNSQSDYRDDDEFEDCVQPYYNNASFSTFANPKRCSIASAASTTTSSVVPVPIMSKNGGDGNNGRCNPALPIIPQDRDGYLKPNEATCNLRNVKHSYVNDAVIAAQGSSSSGGQVQQVQVDVHTPTKVQESSSPAGAGSSSSRMAYQFDSAGSSTSQATTLVAGSSSNNSGNHFKFPPHDDDSIYSGSYNSNPGTGRSRRANGAAPIYMNKAYFGSNSIAGSSSGSSASSSSTKSSSQRIIAAGSSVASDCEPYCSLCASLIMGSPRQQSRMDVVIVKCKECFFSREAESHIRGFFDKLMKEDKQKMDVTLKSYDLKDLDHPADRVVVHCAKVQIVIISHHFLQRLKDEASRRPRLSPINRVFRSKNVIAVLLAVSAQEILDGYEAVLPRFCEWFSVDLRSTNKRDPEFCKKFTEQVIKIYNVELSNSSSFSVFPKKVTREQPKVAILFKKPINMNDEVKIELKTQKQSTYLNDVKLENPHSVVIRIPENLTPEREAIVDVSVYINQTKIGGSRIKSELNLRRMDDDEIDRMSKLVPPFMDWLDKHIANTLLRHYKECTDYTSDPELELMNGIIICKADILPTIMHFAAYYGLQQTALIVLEEADGLAHCNVRNEQNETPSDIAFSRGNTPIGQMIGDYQEISNSYTAYRYIKDLIEKDTGVVEAAAVHIRKDSVGGGMENIEEVVERKGPPKSDESCSEAIAEDEKTAKTTAENIIEHIPSSSTSEQSESPNRTDEDQDVVSEKLIPTPTSRRRRNRGFYVNVDGDPGDNPEKVQTRDKRNGFSPDLSKRRFSMIQTYDIPRTIGEDYKVPPPEIRPVQKKEPEKGASPVFYRKHSGHHVSDSGYLIMNEDGVDAGDDSKDESKKSEGTVQCNNESRKRSLPLERTNSNKEASKSFNSLPRDSGKKQQQLKPNGKEPPVVKLDPADEQLIELMNDFKNNAIDIRTLELLFENWKQRPDVQKSMEERVKQVDQLREQYKKWTQQNAKGTKKSSTLERIKTIWKRKKSNVTAPFDIPLPTTKDDQKGMVSPTGLTFTGPSIPSTRKISDITLPRVTSTTTPSLMEPNIDFRASESSYRFSSNSQCSTSSAESELSESVSNKSNKPLPQGPLEYHNPLCQRFIPAYVSPTPPSQNSGVEEKSTRLQSQEADNISYQVPPPPRPVKPKRLPDEVKASPKPPRKPPVIPEGQPMPSPSPSSKKVPPEIPAKPKPKYLEEITSPPPAPPPRSNNSPCMFSYIDYKAKSEGGNDDNPATKQSYENMTNENESEH